MNNKKNKSIPPQHRKIIATKEPQPDNKKQFFILSGIILLTIIVFSSGINNEFVAWDDNAYIMENKYIKDLSAKGLKTIFTVFYEGNYHPLTCLSNAIEFKIWGLNPKPYHITNLILHLLNTVLVFYFVLKLLNNNKTNAERVQNPFSVEVAAIVSLFFAIHPMHTESVTWMAERKDVLYSFFFLLSLNFWLKSYTVQSQKLHISYLLSLVFFILSCLSKSAAVTLPVVLILIAYYKQPLLTSPKGRNFGLLNNFFPIGEVRWGLYIPFFLIALIFGIIAIKSQGSKGAMDLSSDFNAFDRIFLASYAVMFYIYKLFIPINLSAIHHYPPKLNGLLPTIYYLAPLGVATITTIVLVAKKYKKEIVFSTLFFLVTSALTLQIIPVGGAITGERYTYIPYIGLFFFIAKILSPKFESPKSKVVVLSILIGYSIVFSVITFQRNKVWKDTLTLFDDIILKDPTIYQAYTSRGLARVGKDDKGAMEDYNESIRLNPNYVEALINRGVLRARQKNHQGALEDYNEVIRVDPTIFKAYYNRGNAKGILKDIQGSIEDYTSAIRVHPDYPEAYFNRALAKYNLQDLKGAIEDCNEAIKLNPNYADAYTNRGVAKFAMQDKQGACEDWKMGAALNSPAAKSNVERYCK